jgi:hypothetical protein
LFDASGEPLVPADVQMPRSDAADTEIDLGAPIEAGEERRESVVVPAGTFGAYAWKEDEEQS